MSIKKLLSEITVKYVGADLYEITRHNKTESYRKKRLTGIMERNTVIFEMVSDVWLLLDGYSFDDITDETGLFSASAEIFKRDVETLETLRRLFSEDELKALNNWSR